MYTEAELAERARAAERDQLLSMWGMVDRDGSGALDAAELREVRAGGWPRSGLRRMADHWLRFPYAAIILTSTGVAPRRRVAAAVVGVCLAPGPRRTRITARPWGSSILAVLVESPWGQFTSQCQRVGHPPQLNKSPF
eukprot:COSAG01_NODE_1404_length_10443_cov_29.217517_9_plen_138_part_00